LSGPWERYRQPAAPAGPWQRYQPATTPAPTPTPAPAPRTVPAAVTTVTPQQADAYTRPRATPQQRQRDDARRGFEREFVRQIGTPETRRARALDNSDVPLTAETQADIADITAPGEGVIDFFDDYLTAGGAMVSRGIDRFAQALQTFNAENPLPWTSEENIARARAIAESRRAAAVNAEALTGAVRPGTVTIEDVVANPGLGNIGSFAGQAITQSIPATALALVNLPASVASLTGGLGQDRAVHDGRRDLSITDAAIAAPVALGSTLLDRLGITRALSPLGTTVLGRATSAAGTNIFTEGTQEALEYAGGSVGTDTGFDPEQAAMSALAGAIAGTGQGVALSLGQDAAAGAANAVDRLGEDITARAYRDEADETFRRDSPFRILEAFDPNNGIPLTPSAGEGVASRPPAASPPDARVPVAPAAPEAATPTPEPAAPPAPLPLPETQQQGVAEPVTPAPTPNPVDEVLAPSPPAPAPQPRPANARRVIIPGGGRVDVTNEIVDASQLRFAEGEQQNRQRDRAASEAQIMSIIGEFDPEQLGDDNYSDRGAPIVGPDGTILSGNGRTMAINRIYDERPELAARYRQFLVDQGYDITGIDRPVLIRRSGEMTPEQMRSFVTGSNVDTKLQLSRPEQAAQDASDILTPEMMARYVGGSLTTQRNGGFVESFIAALPQSQRGQFMDDRGNLSTDGLTRIENAMLARAYGNGSDNARRFLSRAMEQTDNQTRTLTGALSEVAPAWGAMTQAMTEGTVDRQYDLTDKLLEAIAIIADTKGDGESVRNVLESDDMFRNMDPVVERLMRAFHSPDLRRMRSKQKIADMLERYARIAMEQRPTPDMFGDVVLRDPMDVLNDAILGDQGDLLAAEDRVPEFDDEDTDQFDEDEDVLEDRSGITADDKGGYQTGFMESAFTNRPSVYEGAILATGVDPAKFRNLPPERRFALLQRVFTDLTGINVKMTKGMPINKAIDQLNDAFTTFQSLAYMLGVSPRTLSLRGTLSLELVGKANFLGAYYPGETKIALPGRSNSFAHEWAHALDYELLRNLTDEDARGLTGLVRKEGTNFAPQNVRQAFVNLLNTMFFDETGMAIKIMDLEAQIAATKSAKTKADLQGQIDRFKAGSSQSRTARSRFYQAAQSMDGTKGNYWTSPTEMFARAFETYVGAQAAAYGLGTEVISKNDQQYRSDTEKDFELRYPKAEERDRIFIAIGQLMEALAREQILKETDQRATEAPDPGTLRRITDFDRRVRHVDNGGLLKQQMDQIAREARVKARAQADRAGDPKSALQRLEDVAAISVYSMAGKVKMIHKRWESPTALRIHDMLAWEPGRARRVGQTFTEEVEKNRNGNLNRMAKILQKYNLTDLTDADLQQLRDALLGDPPADTPQNIIDAAGDFRQLMDAEHYRATNAGLKLGYARGVGYLQRALDVPLVMGDQVGFVEKASDVYRIVFDREIGDSVDALFENETIGKFMALGRKAGIDLKAIKAINRRISQLESQQKKSDDPDQIAAKLEQLYEERSELLGEIFDQVRDFFAERKAAAWLHKILSAADVDFDAASPDSSFTKRRELPPEADKIMADFYTRSPIEGMQNYFSQSARRIAYARRFGVDGKKRQQMLDAMTKEGVPAEDQIEVMKVVDIATGRVTHGTSASAQRALSAIHAYGTLRLLPRAVLSSLAEPMAAGLVAGKGGDAGFKAFAGTLGSAVGSLNGRDRVELAEALGLIVDSHADTIFAERFGGVYGGVTRFDVAVTKMFVQTGLHALTRVQRAGTLNAAHAMLMNSAKRAMEGDVNAKAFLTELGVSDVDTFSRELIDKGRMPTVEELDSAWGEDYGLAATRFVNMTIQNPDPMMRAQLANNPVGRILYGIMSFSMSFWRNITKRQILLTKGIYQRSGIGAAAWHVMAAALPGAAWLLVLNGLVSSIRELIMNPDKVEEHWEQGDLPEYLFEKAFFRTASFGMLDPIIQAVMGVKYQRDLSNIMAGPHLGVLLQDIGTVVAGFWRDSDGKVGPDGEMTRPGTNTAEYNSTRAAYNMLVAPALSFALTRVPGGPLLDPVAGAAQMYVTSPNAGNRVATAIQGPKGTKTDPETGEALETPEEVEARLEAKRQRRIEREREEAGE